jgi:hypothetical protein
MSANPQTTNEAAAAPVDAAKANEKELNFNKLRQGYEKQLEQERLARQQLEQEYLNLKKSTEKPLPNDDDYDDDEPYVDKKRLKKESAKIKIEALQESKNLVQQEVAKALAQERQQNWLKNNPDYYEVMQHAEKFAEKDPELAETILQMPEGFDRQKLVYKNIKALGLHKKEEPKSNIQDKINSNMRSPYYQPSGVGTAPYNNISIGRDISPSEGKNAYQKMRELKQRLRLS